MHIDIVLPKPASLHGYTLFIHLYYDFTHFHLVYPAKDRSEPTVKLFLVSALAFTKKLGLRIYTIRSDIEGALNSDRIIALLSEEGITYERTVASTLEQNGLAEASGDILIRKARALRVHADLPQSLWPDLIQTASYLDNRTPREQLGWKTPYEMVYNAKPYIGNIRIIGSKSFLLDKAIPHGRKFQPRAYIGYLIGYDAHNIWRFWVPMLGDRPLLTLWWNHRERQE